MADIPILRLVTNPCSIVYESRAYKLKYTGTPENRGMFQSMIRKGAKLDYASTQKLTRTPHGNDCPANDHAAYKIEKQAMLKKPSAEEAKTICQIYDEEAASAEPSTYGQFPLFKEVRSVMYKQRAKRFQDFPVIVRILFLRLNLQEPSLEKRFEILPLVLLDK
ncbi:hypothetical protein T4B_9446 [Trichinella pseudospiralis]|uniref:Uncharacterized protein n=1 Tax=Trichinella pseudospiralis TaxID=6337 RepID=A0A0V1DYH7_TRIPS|nr:hypothetical protein T4A_4416 [Trichinella pseudospiralis]KRZ09297.1 hypothetical protein T4B_9446 [Trichinella pseudospiralis]KRZ35840.1 hypothetical protein T4C_9907 [Trichinella pseudospiralis]